MKTKLVALAAAATACSMGVSGCGSSSSSSDSKGDGTIALMLPDTNSDGTQQFARKIIGRLNELGFTSTTANHFRQAVPGSRAPRSRRRIRLRSRGGNRLRCFIRGTSHAGV